MLELIKQTINNETITGIIPLNPKRLKLKFANKSYASGAIAYLIMFLISLVPSLFLFGLLGFILNFDSVISRIILIILIVAVLMIVSESIYVNKIMKYPEAFLVLSKSDLYCFVIKDNQILLHHKFNTDINKLSQIFFGQINKRTKKVGELFEIRQNNVTTMSGKINIKNNQLYSNSITNNNLMKISELQKIYLL